MTNTINNVPRELLERAAYTLELAYEVDTPTVRDIRALLSAPSPAGVDGWDVAGDILEKLSAAQAIIDGLRGEVARYKTMSDNYCAIGMDANQRIGELAQILRDLVPGCKWRIMRPRIDAALAEIDNGN